MPGGRGTMHFAELLHVITMPAAARGPAIRLGADGQRRSRRLRASTLSLALLLTIGACGDGADEAPNAALDSAPSAGSAANGAAAPADAAVVTLTPPKAGFEFDAETEARQRLTRVALGLEPADLLIRGARVLNVFTLDWMDDHDIVIAGERIAWVGPSGDWQGEAAAVHEAAGRAAVPGFGEAHKHIESTHLTPEYEAALVLPQGTTWIAEGSHEFANVSSAHNVDFWLMAEDAGSPLKIFPALGSATPPTAFEAGGGYYGHDEVTALIGSDRRVVGLDEVMDWPAVWNPESPGYQRLWETMQATRNMRAVIEGHGSGLTGLAEINAMAAAGLSSDHEVRIAREAWDKMQRGIFLQLRPDAVMLAFPYFVAQGLKDWSNISVTTDDRNASTSLQLGTMDHNIRIALRAGAPLEAAYAMGSYYTARHWHLEDQVGSIAPGRYADVVLLDDVQTVQIDRVWSKGVLVGIEGEYVGPMPVIDYPEWASDTIDIGRTIVAADFEINVGAGAAAAEVALLEPFWFAPDFMRATLPVAADGTVLRDPDQPITKVALIDRYHGLGAVSKMFWQGVGPITADSAASCSIAHDLHNVWVIGSSDAAMAVAANHVAAMQGGCVLVRDNEVVASVRYEIGGLMTQRPAAEVAAEIDALHAAADEMEWYGESPGWPHRMIFAFLTCSPWKWVLVAPYEGNPAGFVNVATSEIHPVAWAVAP